MSKDVFVLGLLDWQRKELQTVDHARDYRFHSLLSFEELVEEHTSFDELLRRARKQLDEFDGEPHAIICHWDFPSSCLMPILAKEYGLRAPSLEAVLKCEHKYWARLEQRKVVPECVPEFQALDPFDPDAADKLELDFPFWLKPVKGFSSQLGFYINSKDELRNALAEMREHIGEMGKPFNECLAHADLPPEVQGIGGNHALAEGIISGEQVAPEGYVLDGEVHIHGMFEMVLKQGGKEISHLRYPADLPSKLYQRIEDVAHKVLGQVGFDNGCYNIEFLWDEPNDKLWLIEVNTRMSQSHSDLFLKVDGMSNHEVALSVAEGHKPHLPPGHKGRFKTAGKFMLNKRQDAKVDRVPDSDEVAEVSRELGDALIEIGVEPGDQLSELPNQPEYCYTVAEAWIGGDSEDELLRKVEQAAQRLPFKFSDGQGLSR